MLMTVRKCVGLKTSTAGQRRQTTCVHTHMQLIFRKGEAPLAGIKINKRPIRSVSKSRRKKKRGEEMEKDICKLGESNEESTQYILPV